MLHFFSRRSALLVLAAACMLPGAQLAHATDGAKDPNIGVQSVAENYPLENAPEGQAVPINLGGGFDIRIDLNTSSSVPGNWNNISALTGLTANLIDFTSGAGTGVSIDGTGSPWNTFTGDADGTFPDQDWLIQPATVDGAGLQVALTGSFVLAGLPDGTYQIELVSARTAFDYLNTFTVNGATADRTFLGTPVATPWNASDDGLTPGNWLIWDNVVPVAGAITITDQADADTLGILNAIRVLQVGQEPPTIEEIPTLSGWGLIALALALCVVAGLLLRRRIA